VIQIACGIGGYNVYIMPDYFVGFCGGEERCIQSFGKETRGKEEDPGLDVG
jgi:hypothetical protein